MYARRDKNCPNFELCKEELLRFFDIILISGYHSLPSEQDYWSNQADLGVPDVSVSLSTKRFLQIKSMFHLVDSRELENNSNKIAKVAPIYDTLNSALSQYEISHKFLSVDESMVPYYGRHSCKMFIRGKPIRFGYKIWCLCGENGYPYHLSIYTGKSDNSVAPLGTRVVQGMVDVVREHSDPMKHELFFDNFFTSYNLLEDQNVKAIGTVRENRTLGATKKMKTLKEMKRSKRGSFDFCSDGKIYFCKWNDNYVVNIGSNHVSHLLVQTVKRRVKKDSNVSITQPQLIKKYNLGMGGVDVMDRLLGSYRPITQGKKWYWSLIINAINISVVAAIQEKPMTHLEFRREITICLLKIEVQMKSDLMV